MFDKISDLEHALAGMTRLEILKLFAQRDAERVIASFVTTESFDWYRLTDVLPDQYSLPYQRSVAGHCDTFLNRIREVPWRIPGEFFDVSSRHCHLSTANSAL